MFFYTIILDLVLQNIFLILNKLLFFAAGWFSIVAGRFLKTF